MADTVKVTFNAEQRDFVEQLLRSQQFQGNMVDMQRWTQLMDEALLALHVEKPGVGRAFVITVECAEFLGYSVQNTQYSGPLDAIKKIQAVGTGVIHELNRVLEPVRRRRERDAKAADRKAKKAAKE